MSVDATIRHAFAYTGTPLQLADEHSLVYISGHMLQFTSTVTNSQHFLLWQKPRDIVAFDCNWKTATIAVVVREPKVEITLFSNPDKKLRGKLMTADTGSAFEYSHIKFSRCGSRLVSLQLIDSDEEKRKENHDGGKSRGVAPISSDHDRENIGNGAQSKRTTKHYKLFVWDLERMEPLTGCESGIVTMEPSFVSFDPSNADQLVVGGDEGLQIWKIYRGRNSNLLRHTTIHSPTNATLTSGQLTGDASTASIAVDLDVDQTEWYGQWICHAWATKSRILVANRAGQLVVVDANTGNIIEVIAPALRTNRCGIVGIVYTSETIVLVYADGLVVWLKNERDWAVLQTTALPGSIASHSSSGSLTLREDDDSSGDNLVISLAPTPSFSKVYVGTRNGHIYELKTTVLEDDDEEEETLQTTASTNRIGTHSSDSHLVVPCGSFPTGPGLACTMMTPYGGLFLHDALVVSGGVNGKLYFWSLSKYRLVMESSMLSTFSHKVTVTANVPGDANNTNSASSLPTDHDLASVVLNTEAQIHQNNSHLIITALAARPADPILMVGDHTGRLRALCVAKVVGGDGDVELLPLHSVQLMKDAPLDILAIHPNNQPVLLAASTLTNTVFFVSMDHEKHFPVLAYFRLLEPLEHVVDVRWSVPEHNPKGVIVTCFSSCGLFYVARYHPQQQQQQQQTSVASKEDLTVGVVDDKGDMAPVLLQAKIVAFGEEMLSKCSSLQFLNNTPMSMMLATSPLCNDLVLMKYMEIAIDPTEKITMLSKILVQGAHENGISAIVHYPRSMINGSELVATAGMNGVVTLWMVSFSGSDRRGIEREWELEDVQITKKKTVVAHSGPVTTLMFLNVGDDVFLLSSGSDGCVFLLDVHISQEIKPPPPIGDLFSMNPSYMNVFTFAKYDNTFQPEQERITQPFLELLQEQQAVRARNRFDRLKDQTRRSLSELELKLKALLVENEKLPESERLERDEFVINVEWRDQLVKSNKDRAAKVREGILKDLAKMNIVRERMKQEFWDSATVQGLKLRGLTPPSTTNNHFTGLSQKAPSFSPLFVYNFPMRRFSKKEELVVKQVELLRLIEFEHHQQEISSSSSYQQETALTRFQEVMTPNIQWLIDAGSRHPSLQSKTSNITKDNAASITTYYNELQSFHLFYHPAAIRTRKQQRIQIQLLKAYIRFLLTQFNAEFMALTKLKESKIDEIEVKNARMLEICGELGSMIEVFKPQWAPDEVANSILEVKPEEMTQQMYETEEIRRKREQEAQEKLELERQRQKDDVAGRALGDMMGGTLEVKKETLVTQTLVKEPWMLEIPMDEMTVEQKKLVAQFELAQQKFQEEKEKYKKSLDLELKKTKSEITDICKAFDDKLRVLQETYLAMRQRVLVQQLYELRLAEDLMDHEHLVSDRQAVKMKMRDLQEKIQASELENEKFASQLEMCREEWCRAVEEDKFCEKNFHRELEENLGGGSSSGLDHELIKHLVDLYKKRKADDLVRDGGDGGTMKKAGAAAIARRGKSSQHLLSRASNSSLGSGSISGKQRLLTEGLASSSDASSHVAATLLQSLQKSSSGDDIDAETNFDPFLQLEYVSLMPSKQQSQLRRLNSSNSGSGGGQRQVTPLDYETDRPEGVLIEDRVWRVLNALRTKKILAEFVVKEKADQFEQAKVVAEELRVKLTELQLALQEQTEIHEAITHKLTALAENSPLLVHIKQGQDETNSSASATSGDQGLLSRCNVSDALLVARSSVESLNDVIQLHGKDQVNILTKIKNFRKNINVMEWEHTLLQMETNDMEERYTDIQLLRVTKDLQELFHKGDTSEKQKRELALLEAKMVHLGKSHQTNLLKIDDNMTKLHKQLRERMRENQAFQEQVQQLDTQVQIREDILLSRKSAAQRNASNASSLSQKDARLKAITVRRKLVDLAKAQSAEIEFLRLELDKMRRRSFPSFAQQQTSHSSDNKYY